LVKFVTEKSGYSLQRTMLVFDSIAKTMAILAREELAPEERAKIRRELELLTRELASLDGLVNCFHFYSSDR
jgi:hypothetical protein